jgi:hypothetical protein
MMYGDSVSGPLPRVHGNVEIQFTKANIFSNASQLKKCKVRKLSTLQQTDFASHFSRS